MQASHIDASSAGPCRKTSLRKDSSTGVSGKYFAAQKLFYILQLVGSQITDTVGHVQDNNFSKYYLQ